MIETYIQALMQYIHHHPHIGLFVTFVTACLESLALVGSVIPGVVTMTGIGILVGSHILSAPLTILASTLGALLGDYLSFWFGNHFKTHLFSMWPFRRYPHWIHKGEQFFKKHGIKSVVIGRFFGPMRSMVPMIAGMLNMSVTRFTFAAIPSALLWSISYMLPGIFIGILSMELPPTVALLFIVWSLLILAAFSLLLWLLERYCHKLHLLFDRLCHALWNTLHQRRATQWMTRSIAHPKNSNDHTPLRLLLGLSLSVIFFLLLLQQVMHQGPLTAWNRPLHTLLLSFHFDMLQDIMVAISLFGSPQHTLLYTGLAIACYLAIRRYWQAMIHWLMAFVLPFLMVKSLKFWVASPRPHDILSPLHSFSFPSGHTTMSAAALLFFGVLFAKHQTQEEKRLTRMIIGLLIFLIGFSRLYLSAHWLTDVIGGVLLALACTQIIKLSYFHKAARHPKPRPLVLFGVFSWCLISALMIHQHAREDAIHCQPRYPLWTTPSSPFLWWKNKASGLPLYRNNRFGHPAEPFNIQWFAQSDQIVKTLKQQGWQPYCYTGALQDFIYRLASWESPYHLPLLAHQLNGHPPYFIFIKPADSHLNPSQDYDCLRLWASNQTSKHTPTLWIGTLTHHTVHRYHFFHHGVITHPHLLLWFVRSLPPHTWQSAITTLPSQEKIVHIRKK